MFCNGYVCFYLKVVVGTLYNLLGSMKFLPSGVYAKIFLGELASDSFSTLRYEFSGRISAIKTIMRWKRRVRYLQLIRPMRQISNME